jgi:hypothetical protein
VLAVVKIYVAYARKHFQPCQSGICPLKGLVEAKHIVCSDQLVVHGDEKGDRDTDFVEVVLVLVGMWLRVNLLVQLGAKVERFELFRLVDLVDVLWNTHREAKL